MSQQHNAIVVKDNNLHFSCMTLMRHITLFIDFLLYANMSPSTFKVACDRKCCTKLDGMKAKTEWY